MKMIKKTPRATCHGGEAASLPPAGEGVGELKGNHPHPTLAINALNQRSSGAADFPTQYLLYIYIYSCSDGGARRYVSSNGRQSVWIAS